MLNTECRTFLPKVPTEWVSFPRLIKFLAPLVPPGDVFALVIRDLGRKRIPFRINGKYPHASFLVGSASRWMKNMSEVDLMSGFGRRLIFVPGDPKPPIDEPDPPDENILVPLADAIKGIIEHWRQNPYKSLELSGPARKLWSSWYKTYKARAAQDDLIGAMSIGDRTTCRKIASG